MMVRSIWRGSGDGKTPVHHRTTYADGQRGRRDQVNKDDNDFEQW